MEKIFLLSGKAESGKNVVASIIKEYYEKNDNKVIVTAFAKYLKLYAKEIINWDGNDKNKPREFLQTIGIELIKNKIAKDFLIKRMLEDILIYDHYAHILVISDARFIDEINAIKNNYKNVITIYIKGIKNSLTKKQKEHISETALDNYHEFNYMIDNTGNKKELESKVINILKEV